MNNRRIGWVSGIGIYLRGLAMGAADLVPGVSGGTIAFITGIYERLLNGIGAASGEALPLLLRGRLAAAWRAMDGNFLAILLSGVLTSIVLLANIVGWLLEQHPIILWAFFCGLILASSVHLMRQVRDWSLPTVLAFVIGALLALAVAFVKPVSVEPSLLMVFGAGAIAICAMILPGISGSFLLVLMGLYAPILDAVRNLDLMLLSIFASGCVVGLLSFARIVSWLLHRYHDRAMSTFTGFLFGSLVMVWPWKQVLTWYVGSGGEQMPLTQRNVLPHTFEALTAQDPQTAMAVAAAFTGFLLVWALERHGARVRTDATVSAAR